MQLFRLVLISTEFPFSEKKCVIQVSEMIGNMFGELRKREKCLEN